MPLARIRGQLFDALVGPRDRRGVRVFVLHPPPWNQCTTVGGRHGVKRTPSVQEDPYMARYISLVRALPKVWVSPTMPETQNSTAVFEDQP